MHSLSGNSDITLEQSWVHDGPLLTVLTVRAGHGTHVAGTVGGFTVGVNKGAYIHAVKARAPVHPPHARFVPFRSGDAT